MHHDRDRIAAPEAVSAVADTGSSAILRAVEQKTGQSIPPIPPAGVDPAYIPGLTPPARPAAGAPPAGEAEDAAETGEAAAAALDAAPDDARTPGAEAESAPEADTAAEAGPSGEEAAEDTGPVFTVSDRRGSITADRTGITFKLDGESADFGWDEIGAVEIDTPRFGRRFSVTVYTSSRRWFDNDVEAPSKAQLKTWAAELEAVLDTYFEDDEAKEAEAAEAAGSTAADTTADTTADAGTAPADEAEEDVKVTADAKAKAKVTVDAKGKATATGDAKAKGEADA
jgi:hypothetical protein